MNPGDWLPKAQQMSDAAQLRKDAFSSVSMRQALGMVVLMGIVAGLLPFLVNWWQAASVGAALPLARLAEAGARMNQTAPPVGPAWFHPAQLGQLFQTIAGLGQPLPGWLAAFLSALGEWINWPLRWLSAWIVYGSMVMVSNKALGATNRLQPFFAATGFAAAPLLLTGLSPIPCIGGLLAAIGVAWAFVVYIHANEAVTGFSRGRNLAAVLAPALVLLVLGGLISGAALLWLLLAVVGF